ncbi:MAG: hypothetical protein HGB23_06805 [Chlorobiaceae bacterium]|nr:hypothetical protein [Chlorobiaceae bacterium]
MNLNSEIIREIAGRAREQSPLVNDGKFTLLRKAKVGTPAMVYSPEGVSAFWLVPFLSGDLACGIAQVELSGQVAKIGIFGSTSHDSMSWINASFFKEPPSEILEKIHSVFSRDVVSDPVFSFDTSPSRWAWMLTIKSEGTASFKVFITPGSWYKRE